METNMQSVTLKVRLIKEICVYKNYTYTRTHNASANLINSV